jgi:hypothetical protein
MWRKLLRRSRSVSAAMGNPLAEGVGRQYSRDAQVAALRRYPGEPLYVLLYSYHGFVLLNGLWYDGVEFDSVHTIGFIGISSYVACSLGKD